jgi:protein-S-isoprenylcysteine O-methyltransferase Ste14
MNNSEKANQPIPTPSYSRSFIRWAIKQTVFVLIIAAALFLSAGHSDSIRSWIFLLLAALGQVMTAFTIISYNPGLLVERTQLKDGLKAWDIGLAVLMGYSPAWLGLAAGFEMRLVALPADLDVWIIIGIALALAGTILTLWAMAVNPFFSGIVRIQHERGHRVASAGPYRYIRHPGYSGMLIYTFATLLILGSLWALGMAIVITGITLLRTALEDRTLQSELTGYADYAQRVRYRLVPGIW